MQKFILLLLITFFFQNVSANAQHEQMNHEPTQPSHGSSHQGMRKQMKALYGSYPMTRESSGTSWQPDSSPHEGLHFMKDDWMFMIHGFANVIYDHQGGDRGDKKTFSESMFMFMGQRDFHAGTLGFRSMFSLDPLQGKDGYPLLLQTGETADGISPLIDRQHPHDLFMELAMTYSLPLSDQSSIFGYVGLPGEPALGPPAFMHRLSGMDNPEAPISHHWLDSTHITYGVTTLGYIWNNFKIEGSAFRGREPDEDRWDIEGPELDSYATRLSYNPTENWSFQASYGDIDSPEQLHSDVDTQRYTASAAYNKPFEHGNWQMMLAWGRNNNEPGHHLNAFLWESSIQLKKMHTFFTRFERTEKDELFPEGDPLEGEVFKVNKSTLGYVYDFSKWKQMKWGIGASYSWHFLPNELDPAYGKDPESFMIFARIKL
ncbi:MAG: hypothetical protein NUV91_09470 [Candidatus Omnitrophica bacterium]|nr:hypothetical protein [Candidatus Omnitrophota bacterium]